jgi:hypothetical protein
MSWRLWRPRHISTYEAQILRRLLQVAAHSPPSAALLASIDDLIVRDEGGGGSEHDSLDFACVRANGKIIAAAIGLMTNDTPVEVILWADGDVITYLELEPFGSETRRPIRIPILESIRPYPDNAFGDEEGDGDGEANDPTST